MGEKDQVRTSLFLSYTQDFQAVFQLFNRERGLKLKEQGELLAYPVKDFPCYTCSLTQA